MDKICTDLLERGMKTGLIIPFVIASIFWNFGASYCLAGDQALGELRLEGKHIERLVLRREDDHTERFDRPGEVVELPVGQYHLMESHMDGGYACFQGPGSQNKWITIAENKPAVLKAGAPLKQTLEVKWQGRTLALDYKLLGIGGEAYARADRSNPPSFTVYKGDQEIASGQLAYGWGGSCSYSWRVPRMTFGELRFVSSVDIGDLGPSQGLEVVYNWRWYHSIPSLALWLVLAATLIIIKSNRTPRILLILVPLLIVNILWFLLSQMINFSSAADVEMFNMMLSSLVAAITFLWLFTPQLCRYNPWIAFFLAFALITMFFLLGIVSYLGFEFSQNAVVALAMLTVLALGMLLGFVLAGWCCRKRYGPVRFMLWLAVSMVVVCLASMLVFYVIVWLVLKAPIPINRILLIASMVGLILAICLYVINLPYMILALWSSFFHERFYACLRLKAVSEAPKQTDTGRINEQNSGTEIPEKGDLT